MSRPKRFFVNNLPDYHVNNEVQVSVDDIKTQILRIVDEIIKNVSPNEKNADGGLYVGIGGIAYMFYYLSKFQFFNANEKQSLLQKGIEYLQPALAFSNRHIDDPKQKSAFLLGNAGVYAVASALYNEIEDRGEAYLQAELYKSVAINCKPKNFLKCGGDEYFVGRAGYICGTLWLSKVLKTEVISQKDIADISDSILSSGREYAQANSHHCPLMFSYYGTEYLGAAHGLCFILETLMSVSDRTLDPNVRRSVDYLLSLQMPNGNFPCAMDEISEGSRSEENELVHWCHGAPGVVYMIAKAYLIWKDKKYLDSCLKCGELVWQKGLLKKGPGICHGVAGNGYVFLLLYRLTNDPKHLHRAIQFANFMETEEFKKNSRTPDCPYSLYEGWAGTACYLADLTKPDVAAFPFQDVF